MSTETLALLGVITGAVGTMTGVVALAWQIITHRQSGCLVSVESAYAMPVYGPTDAPWFEDDDQVVVRLINRGGAPVTVTNYGVSMDGKSNKRNLFVPAPPSWARRLPLTVEPGGQPAELYVPVADLRNAHSQHQVRYQKMRPWVELGDGRRIYSRPLK